MISSILIDLDGVLSDFLGGALRLFDFDPLAYPPGEYAIWKPLGITQSDFWQTIERNPTFWEDLEPYPWCAGVIATLASLKEHRGINWTIATGPSRDPSCPMQKVRWMQKHIRRNFTNYMIGARKALLARPTSLLIDDSPENIKAFREAGGMALLFPHVANGFQVAEDPGAWLADRLRAAVLNPGAEIGEARERESFTTDRALLE